ncbi:TadE-like protein [Jannaschia faecimaris]|uniref:TadE-like protein n=1 Tax=Jannaschia faecimaris TaxID=1244108 RepID=A0A1H3TKT2_9RHOB|nr:TadE/TadG family type IV pilus assembly protein [Jannaschia faecimaris]SDZ50902.1 TadE-like protein [Jannaschia faecimaris]
MMLSPKNRLKQFLKSEDGVAVVEFVISLPLMILIFAIIVEFGRLFIGYQAVLSGVQDASRYLGRIAPVDICPTDGSVTGGTFTGGIFTDYETDLKTRIETDRSDNSVLPSQFAVTGVDATYACVPGDFRTSPAPVATVAAQISVQFPLGFLFGIFGNELDPFSATVSGSSRIF